MLFQRVLDDSLAQLNSRAKVSQSPLLSPSLRLLSALQRSLLSRVDDHSIRPLVVQYSARVFSASNDLLETATGLLSASKEKDSALPGSVEHILRSSVVGVLLPSLLSTLSRRDLLYKVDTGTLSGLVRSSSSSSSLLQLLQRLDSHLFHHVERSAVQDASFLNQSIPPAKRLMHTVETAHPYDGRRVHSSLAFSACHVLILYFDPRSAIHKNDSLILSSISGDLRAPAITGSAFPKLPLIIPGDSLTVSFNADSQAGGGGGKSRSDKLWGFRVIIHGVRLSPLLSLPWSSDLLNSLALLSARVVHALTFTLAWPTPSEEVRALLGHELFTGGVPRGTEAASHERFLQALIQNESPARELMELLLKKVLGRPPLSGTARKAISTVERVMAAALLYHSDLVSVAQSVAQELMPGNATPSSGSPPPYPELAMAHPDFALLQPLFKQLYALDAVYLAAARVEKRWLDLMAAGATDGAAELKAMQGAELTQLALAKGVTVDKNDSAVTAQRLSKRLAQELSRVSAGAAPAAGADLWVQAYSSVSQRIIDRCMFLLSLRNPSSSYPPLHKAPAVPHLSSFSELSYEDEAQSGASSHTQSPSLSPRASMSRSYTDQLKRVPSTSSPDSHSLPLSRVNSSSAKNLTRSVLGRPTLTESPLRTQKAGVDYQTSFAVWKQRERAAHSASNQSLAAHEQQQRMTTQDRRVRSILAYLASPSSQLDAPLLVRALEDRHRLAMDRVEGLLSFHHLLQSCHFDSARNSLLLGFGEGIRRYWSGGETDDGHQQQQQQQQAGKVTHYLSGLNGIGPETAAQVRSAWFTLLDVFRIPPQLLVSSVHQAADARLRGAVLPA